MISCPGSEPGRSWRCGLMALAFLALVVVVTVTPAQGAESQPVGPLASNRLDHTATMLASGSVLIVGGANQASVDLYDPVANRVSPTGAMATPRAGHTATRLADGRVLVVGGIAPDSDAHASAEIYDPAAATWAPTAPMKVGRSFHTATLLRDGKVLVAGGQLRGHGDYHREAELFDPATGAWTSAGAMELGRSYHSATLLDDGRVLVAGGQGASHDLSLRDAVVYDPAANRWTAVPRLMAAGRVGHSAVLLRDGTVLVAGGTPQRQGDNTGAKIEASVEIFDPASMSFSPAPSLGAPRAFQSTVQLPGGRLLVVGGTSRARRAGVTEVIQPSTSEVYDPPAHAWSRGPDLAGAPSRGNQTATLLDQAPCAPRCGQVLVVDDAAAQLLDPAPATPPKTAEARGDSDGGEGDGDTSAGLLLAGGAVALVLAIGLGAAWVRRRR